MFTEVGGPNVINDKREKRAGIGEDLMAYSSEFRHALMATTAVVMMAAAGPAWAQTKTFNVAAQAASSGVADFARQADVQILVSASDVRGRRTAAVRGEMAVDAGLRQLLAGSGLTITSGDGRTFTLGVAPQVQSALPEAATAVEDIIVTAQKREESIQDVPIAVTALTSETLEAMRIDSGAELLRAVPNVSFSKNNFSMYNFSIRGIGTKAVSSSSDPAVAISFNNTPLTRNRLFEQEYLDVSRVEVLRGPQGTLYGRNATGGVVNMIPNLPGPEFDAMLKAEAGNYNSQRGQMMVNIPLTDTFWVRAAASLTKRDGFDYNTFKDTHVNDRDLWSTRLSAAWEPSDSFRTNLIWEHFEEEDQRARTGKQLCTKDPGPTQVGNTIVPTTFLRNRLSQGCLAKTLYSDAAYDTPNGGAFGHIFMAGNIEYGTAPNGQTISAVNNFVDPYLGVNQSRNLREMGSAYDPKFRAKNDLIQFNLELDISENITFFSQTAYAKDDYWSTQDYNRFVSNPIFSDSSQPFVDWFGNTVASSPWITPGGVYTDPQLGASSRMISADVSSSDNSQFVQEFRLQSNYENGFNFSIGANYLDFKTEDNYYVFNNIFTLIAEYFYNIDPSGFSYTDGIFSQICDENATAWKECIYVDPTSLDQLAGDGHNYFRSRNVVNVRSWALFGEGYWDLKPDLRMTVGLRYTDDKKVTTPYPSQLLMGANPDGTGGLGSGGYVSRGYPAGPDIKQSWGAVTGRFVLDWKPDLSFTDDTLVYASYSRGYKGGGTNPPRVDINPEVVQYQPLAADFEPEYVNAFEIGAKNTFHDGRIRLNANAFYYDYKDYQVSQIVDRISLNENFDARIWGLELEGIFHVTDRFRIDSNIGYLNTRVADGEGSIDVMNRTQGNAEWTLLRPWVQVPSNCIAPTKHVETIMNSGMPDTIMMWGLQGLCSGSKRSGSFDPDFESLLRLNEMFGFEYDPLSAPNGGRGIMAGLGGNELPNSPNLTANIGAQYVFSFSGWDMTVRGDYYWQDASYARIFNTEYDHLKAWDNLNLSIVVENASKDLAFTAYVKNVFDDAPITDVFTNSDDTGLTANIFTLDPRLVAFSVSKRF
ncbi:TonB-dependent receptor [Brevundimonas sp. P7753]|uniref:TonB-dependent receptor domain-containing protein n=1 Tax=Brevundimonas sp. P7753 TaxID=2726982 RepID=UPI002107F25F|nr:TonB-dependent receptor [Brevundimonas sp. P7753]